MRSDCAPQILQEFLSSETADEADNTAVSLYSQEDEETALLDEVCPPPHTHFPPLPGCMAWLAGSASGRRSEGILRSVAVSLMRYRGAAGTPSVQGRLSSEPVIVQVKQVFQAKHVIRVCSTEHKADSLAAARKLIAEADRIKAQVNLKGASIAIDDCYQVCPHPSSCF